MSKVTKIEVSVGSMNAIVTLDNGDRHAFNMQQDAQKATAQLKQDTESGALAAYLDMFDSDTPDEIATTVDQGSDWETVYTA